MTTVWPIPSERLKYYEHNYREEIKLRAYYYYLNGCKDTLANWNRALTVTAILHHNTIGTNSANSTNDTNGPYFTVINGNHECACGKYAGFYQADQNLSLCDDCLVSAFQAIPLHLWSSYWN